MLISNLYLIEVISNKSLHKSLEMYFADDKCFRCIYHSYQLET